MLDGKIGMTDMESSPTRTVSEVASPTPRPPFWGFVAEIQDKVALTCGVCPEDREATVSGMLARAPGEAVGYWLKLLLAMGIATLGLVLGSTAVVIGAMLISPLMGPLVELGMGLAVGSPLLVLRSTTRTVASVLVVVGSAALITLALPYQEVTPEIAARTAPTALDLLIAILCAIAAAYTTIRPGSDTTGTAAGTAIGISLVPPLCVVGYGVGTGAKNISSGAALLFTANLCAILLFAVLCFLGLGYSRVRIAASEATELELHGTGGIIRRLARGLRFVFGMKYGPLLRVLMPMVLLAFVAVPLGEALAHVTWQVRVRAAIQRILGTLPENTVRSTFMMERDEISVRLFTLGRAEDASKLEKDLATRIAAVAGSIPKVQVIAVADSTALEAVSAKLEAARTPLPVISKTPTLDSARLELDREVAAAWPSSAGKLLATRLLFPRDAPLMLEVVHLGPMLGAAGEELLGERISRAMGSELVIRDVAVSPEPLVAESSKVHAFLRAMMARLEHLHESPQLYACVEAPVSSSQKPTKEAEMAVDLLHSLPAYESKRLVVTEGERWRMVVTTEPCTTHEQPLEDADAGLHDGGDASAR